MNVYMMCCLPNLTGKPEGIWRLMKSFTLAKWGVFIAWSVWEMVIVYTKGLIGKQFMWEPTVSNQIGVYLHTFYTEGQILMVTKMYEPGS